MASVEVKRDSQMALATSPRVKVRQSVWSESCIARWMSGKSTTPSAQRPPHRHNRVKSEALPRVSQNAA